MYARWYTRYQSERNGRIEGGVEFEVKSVSNVQLGLVGDKIEVIGYVDNVFDDLTPENGVAFVDFFQNFQDTFVTYLSGSYHGCTYELQLLIHCSKH